VTSKILALVFALAMGISNAALATIYTSTDVPKVIPDLSTINSTLSVGDHLAITDVNVRLSLTHSYDSDLDIFLLSPFGTLVELTSDSGGNGNDYTNTVFDDAAAVSITVGAAPFTGTFRPEGLLSALNGQDAFGIWTLRITDDAGPDVGTLNAWSLDILGRSVSVPNPARLRCSASASRV